MIVTDNKSFKQLVVWQKSMELVDLIYKLTTDMPASEKFGLISQMRRSAVSIPSNIAEGYRRKSTAEYLRFLSIADASTAELETQLLITGGTYPGIGQEQAKAVLTEVQKMLFVLMKNLKK